MHRRHELVGRQDDPTPTAAPHGDLVAERIDLPLLLGRLEDPQARALALGLRCGRRPGRARTGRAVGERRCPQLQQHHPHDAPEEEVDEREEAELEDGERGLGDGIGERDREGGAHRAACYEASKRSTVFPRRISSPSASGCSRIAVPFTRVPFIEFRSATTNPFPAGRISA